MQVLNIDQNSQDSNVITIDQDHQFQATINAGATYNVVFVHSGDVTLDVHFVLEENSTLNATWLSHQTQNATQNIRVEFKGENINANLSGLARLKNTEHLTTHTHLIHHTPNTNATQFFKRIIEDRAVSEFQGLVHVKADAQKTDSNQYNHNLILSDFGRAIARPQLEIFADDVKCSHGATIGQLDEEQIFYLQSRGFSRVEAHTILLQGFMDEIIDRIPTQLNPQSFRKLFR